MMEGISSTISDMVTSTIPMLSDPEKLKDFQCHSLWILIIGFQLSFLVGFGMGANDVANAFGTSVGSGALSMKTAYFLATIMETLGAVLVGYNVIDTLRNKVVDLSMYRDSPFELMLGQVASLGGCAIWLIVATLFRLPVASSHSIVGAIIGFTLLMRGTKGIHMYKVAEIAASWVISPVLAGLVSTILYMIVDFAVLRRRNPLRCGLRILPVFYFMCFTFNTFMVVYQGSKVIGLSELPFWLSVVISVSIGTIAALIFQFIVRPRVITWINSGAASSTEMMMSSRKQKPADPEVASSRIVSNGNMHFQVVDKQQIEQQPRRSSLEGYSDVGTLPTNSNISLKSKLPNHRRQSFNLSPKGLVNWFVPRREREEDQLTLRLFSTIQVFTGCFAGFAHGAMDVSHTIAPLLALLAIYNEGTVEKQGQTPLWMIFYGVSGTCFGFWALGHRVMKTIGKKMTEINPCCGFTIEFGAALTVLVASKLGIPISTTHCLVGSVVAVGSIKAGGGVDWVIFRNIIFSWLVTLPASALFSAAIMFLFKVLLLH